MYLSFFSNAIRLCLILNAVEVSVGRCIEPIATSLSLLYGQVRLSNSNICIKETNLGLNSTLCDYTTEYWTITSNSSMAMISKGNCCINYLTLLLDCSSSIYCTWTILDTLDTMTLIQTPLELPHIDFSFSGTVSQTVKGHFYLVHSYGFVLYKVCVYTASSYCGSTLNLTNTYPLLSPPSSIDGNYYSLFQDANGYQLEAIKNGICGLIDCTVRAGALTQTSPSGIELLIQINTNNAIIPTVCIAYNLYLPYISVSNCLSINFNSFRATLVAANSFDLKISNTSLIMRENAAGPYITAFGSSYGYRIPNGLSKYYVKAATGCATFNQNTMRFTHTFSCSSSTTNATSISTLFLLDSLNTSLSFVPIVFNCTLCIMNTTFELIPSKSMEVSLYDYRYFRIRQWNTQLCLSTASNPFLNPFDMFLVQCDPVFSISDTQSFVLIGNKFANIFTTLCLNDYNFASCSTSNVYKVELQTQCSDYYNPCPFIEDTTSFTSIPSTVNAKPINSVTSTRPSTLSDLITTTEAISLIIEETATATTATTEETTGLITTSSDLIIIIEKTTTTAATETSETATTEITTAEALTTDEATEETSKSDITEIVTTETTTTETLATTTTTETLATERLTEEKATEESTTWTLKTLTTETEATEISFVSTEITLIPTTNTFTSPITTIDTTPVINSVIYTISNKESLIINSTLTLAQQTYLPSTSTINTSIDVFISTTLVSTSSIMSSVEFSKAASTSKPTVSTIQSTVHSTIHSTIHSTVPFIAMESSQSHNQMTTTLAHVVAQYGCDLKSKTSLDCLKEMQLYYIKSVNSNMIVGLLVISCLYVLIRSVKNINRLKYQIGYSSGVLLINCSLLLHYNASELYICYITQIMESIGFFMIIGYSGLLMYGRASASLKIFLIACSFGCLLSQLSSINLDKPSVYVIQNEYRVHKWDDIALLLPEFMNYCIKCVHVPVAVICDKLGWVYYYRISFLAFYSVLSIKYSSSRAILHLLFAILVASALEYRKLWGNGPLTDILIGCGIIAIYSTFKYHPRVIERRLTMKL